MRFTILDEEGPRPGERFRFGVAHTVSRIQGTPIRIQALIDKTRLDDMECADPPCHEMSLYIPDYADDSVLTLIARDILGGQERLRLAIGNPRPRPQAMAG